MMLIVPFSIEQKAFLKISLNCLVNVTALKKRLTQY